MDVLQPELSSLRVRESPDELVVEMQVAEAATLAQLSARIEHGVLEIRVPRVADSGDSG
ncbi:MAG TPA: hypothetical protein VHD91_12905 [Gaiellaceae bacterium]|nr:hypothetical protein [Gaiellaceae bacterium]